MARSRLLDLIPDAPPGLQDFLDGHRGPLEPPIRAEIFGLQRFAQHGHSLGATHRTNPKTPRNNTFFPRLQHNIQALRAAHQYIGTQAATGYDISPAGEWLLDNFHLIEAQLREIHEGLPRSYFRSLPVLQDAPLAGLPRIYGVAWAFVAHTDGAFDEELLMRFLGAYQESCELNLSEMWALPTTLRVVLIDNLRRLGERVATQKAAREVANLCCDHIEIFTPRGLDDLLALVNERGVGPVFLAQMAQRLQDRRAIGHDCHHDWLHKVLPDPGASQAQYSADLAADNLSVSNAVTSLREIGDADWPDIVARTSVLMQLMLTSPLFEAEHVGTRDQTLHGIESLARITRCSELRVARTLIQLMHPEHGTRAPTAVASHWLHGPGRPALWQALGARAPMGAWWPAVRHRLALPTYLGTLLLCTLGLVAALLHSGHTTPGWAWLGALLMAFPASEAVVAVINRLISESARPHHLPRLALPTGIPDEHRVLVVIPALLTSIASTSQLSHRLLLHYLANPERHAQFALLTDWSDAPAKHAESDKALLSHARAQIRQLNERYPTHTTDLSGAPRFIVLHRERLFSHSEQRWIGWERKRGKLEQLMAVLAQEHLRSTLFIDLGRESRLAGRTPYVVTLDSDTQLPPGRLRDLVGVAAHPQNQPILDADRRTVVSGYAILQPRIDTPLPVPRDFTLYHWLFAGQCGIDPYSAASSDVYQDLFQEGSFTGKGLLHVQAMHAVLSRRLPDDQVLSHDLLEGAMARCAAVSDVSVIEDAPLHADVASARIHRWTRGDWQLLPFVLQPRRHRLNVINVWKMVDNLRRSLVAPMSLALLLAAVLGHIVSPAAALSLVIAAFSVGPLMGAIAGLFSSRDDLAWRHFYRHAGTELARALWGGLWLMAQLLAQAMMSMDAIARALYRLTVSRRHLLQWTTAAAVQASASSTFPAALRQHWRKPALALSLLASLILFSASHPVLATVLCLLWAASPLWTWWVSRPCPVRQEHTLLPQERAYLDTIARDTWRFFERCVDAQNHHLPPDNLQTTPHDMVAHRTSPTNIGLYLLSVTCARRFGWIGTQDLLQRMDATLTTLDTLQRHRGHFLNWYDTLTGAPLLPMYVSTVDSGNLSSHLLATAQACRALAAHPYDDTANQQALRTARDRIAPGLDDRHTLTPDARAALRWGLADHRHTRQSVQRDQGAQGTDPTAAHLLASQALLAVARHCEQLAWQADFSFLHHPKRHLLHIGFRVAEQQLDGGFYDLLASESRVTSLVAMAKGDVPVRHWASLGRPFYANGAQAGLRSWSGSMFEYLMPQLVLDEPYGGALHGACLVALQEQIAFTLGRGLPWGISESAYAGHDHTLAYQYAPQGVPRLALRRTPADELVIAPYATALAAQLSPHEAARNFTALEALSARGRYGFIDALDFSPTRQTGGDRFTPVNTFMAHHQGMSIVALTNVLHDGIVRRWGMANAHIEAMSSLLHERSPREVSTLYDPPTGPLLPTLQAHAPGFLREIVPGVCAIEPTHLLSNGRYNVSLRANGAGWSRWGQIGLSRWRDDALRDAHGSFFYVRWDQQPALVSLSQHPAPDPTAHYQSTFHADRVCLDALWPALQSHTTIWVSPEDDIEFRQVELRNLSDRPLDIELMSAFDVTLNDPVADEAHPAFTNLFVKARWLARHQALVFERTPRLPTERGLRLAHFVAELDPQVVSVRYQTDRQDWIGRHRNASQPQGHTRPLPDTGEADDTPLDTGLDPVCVLAVHLRIAPRAKAQLTFATAVSDHGDTLLAVVDKYRQHNHVQRASLMSATLAGIRLRALRISNKTFAAAQTLTTALTLTLTRSPGRVPHLEGAQAVGCDRRSLWRFGISGERPIIVVTIDVMQGLGLLRALIQALRLWSWCDLACDLVVVNKEPASYLMALHRELLALRERHMVDSATQGHPSSAHLHVLRVEDLSRDELRTLNSLARVRLHADGRPLPMHVHEWAELHEQAFDARHDTSRVAIAPTWSLSAASSAPVGTFEPGTGAFVFEVNAHSRPTRPWINVLSNPDFGTQLSETGGGYTWALNSRLNQLTAWSNDPVTDTPSESFLLQDLMNMRVWSVTPSVCADDGIDYRITHGQGHSHIHHRRDDLDVTVTWCVDAVSSVKQIELHLINLSGKPRHLRVIGMVEWMMGARRADRATVDTAMHRQRLPGRQLTTLLCTQRECAGGFGQGTAFLALAREPDEEDDWTCDRREFFDARGQRVLPDVLGQHSGAGLDPCAALSTRVSLAPGEHARKVFLMGYGGDIGAARLLAGQAADTHPRQRLNAVQALWATWLGATTVKTPDPLFDALVNHWLLYQLISCRLWSKSGFYQAGGATGFRDQLQDSMALAWAAPTMLRQQILRGASRQFAEGDVQHWWHAPDGAGVRTHSSDDLLWLPQACVHYVRATGDTDLLDEPVPFLEGLPIPAGAEDIYDTPAIGTEQASVYEHAARTIDRSLEVGIHGLPLMGSGDWNDGMNRVGHLGQGESVWLGWFLCKIVADFAPLARARGEIPRAQRWEQAAQGWRAALNGTAWDGEWFTRAYFDNGQALGSQANAEARIDLIAQAWAVLSGAASPALQQAALTAMDAMLVDQDAGLIKLLDPPLQQSEPSAGYIQAYPPGVRENGGQYTHAGVWALMAQTELARLTPGANPTGDTAYRYFTYLSPAHRAQHPRHGAVYGIEPYAVAGDVYTHEPYIGRGGWSWYTGAAGWLHRAAIESMFGLQLDAQTLSFSPCLPSHWHEAELTLQREQRTMRFILIRAKAAQALAETADRQALLLRPGQPLHWPDLGPDTCFVVALLKD